MVRGLPECIEPASAVSANLPPLRQLTAQSARGPAGTFSPSTEFGMAMVIVLGSISIVSFGWCIAPLHRWLDRMTERAAHAVLIGKGGVSLSKEPNHQHLLHAKLLVGLLACHIVIAIGAALALRESSLSGSGWNYWDCYYFTFVTCSSIGFGDYALGPTDDTSASLIRLLWQAIAILVGMSFFNSSAGIAGDWANALLQAAIARCKGLAVWATRSPEMGHTREGMRTERASVCRELAPQRPEAWLETTVRDETIKPTGVAMPEEQRSVKTISTIPKRWMFLKKASSINKSMDSLKKFCKPCKTRAFTDGWSSGLYTAQAVRRLMIFYLILLVGGVIFAAIEAVPELESAQALRDEENQIRLLAGLPLLGSLVPPRIVHSRTAVTVRAELAAIGTIADPTGQDAAIAGVVENFVSVVDHEQGCDQLADMTQRMLDSCKSSPPDPISLCWTFNGCVFFMLTVMTTIGYGTFAPATAMGKFIVVTYGTIAMTFFGTSLGVIGNCVDLLIDVLTSKLLVAFEVVEAKVAPHLRNHGSYAESRIEARTLHGKMLVALGVLHSSMVAFAGIAQAASAYFNGSPWQFFHCYYFAFATFSTIGFGDFAMGPTDSSLLQLFIVHLQAILIFVGLAAFNAFGSVAADWLPEFVSCILQAASRRMCGASAKVLAHSSEDASAPSKDHSDSTSKPNEGPEVPQAEAACTYSSRLEATPKRVCKSPVAPLLARGVRAILCAYVIMLVGALLLYWAESQNEIDVACASRAEENRARASMRLPPKMDEICTQN